MFVCDRARPLIVSGSPNDRPPTRPERVISRVALWVAEKKECAIALSPNGARKPASVESSQIRAPFCHRREIQPRSGGRRHSDHPLGAACCSWSGSEVRSRGEFRGCFRAGWEVSRLNADALRHELVQFGGLAPTQCQPNSGKFYPPNGRTGSPLLSHTDLEMFLD